MIKRNRTLFPAALAVAAAFFLGHGDRAGASDLQPGPVPFYHESSDEPRLDQLIKEFDFSSSVSAGLTEFQEMALLKNWVYSRVPYDLNYNDSELRDSIRILRRAARKEAFICTTISTVFLQTAVSMGWTPRQVILKKREGDEHAANDIWSNQFRKWVYIDPTWNIHIERRGVPLSMYEIRREWLKNGGRDVVYVFGAGKNEKRYTARDLPVRRNDSRIWSLIPLDRGWLSYFNEIAILGRNDFFSCCNGSGSGAWDPVYVVTVKRSWKDRFRSFFKKSAGHAPKTLFYDLNRVDVHIGEQGGRQGKTVEVKLNAFGNNNYTPNFMEYLVRLNGGDWKVTGDRFFWTLEPGENIVRARIMNRFGVVGPVTEKRLYAQGEKSRNTVHGPSRRNDKKRSIKLKY
ncbi:MAG TPA: hypothetical protein PLM53_20595 [Spirochaetota bacterium]|nr:hypothetical protein [Spirochaetota bacterium]HPC43173.1 hypothetical protein [Spirochaetota bacterium]HPL17897.1 hypothetical protein [Spirochaetota bacterium]HQF10474.1 hypothetical protein [Spirochaetota bacterium]HQH99495.1 hypothetical protein [Spirochaetota bacterium]